MKFLLVYILLGYVAVFVKSHNEFTPEGCLLVHNELRALHKDTLSVEYDAELEKSAEQSANFVKATGGGEDTRPTRVLPKRRRRHVEDIDKNVHIESWDGDIYYPDTSFTPQGTGESIHKMCCRTAPHCPREFFHGLLFPPSAEGVVRDFYNEEMKSYDFASGKKKAQFYTQIKHFTNIVWKKTSKIGCFQTKMDSNNCVYTVIHYKEKGSEGTPEIFKENVGVLLDSEEDSANIVLIFLIVFFIVLFLVLVILCYCCRDRLSEKYYEIKIKTDTMKAEQELETDSTAFWWLKIFKKKRRTVKRPTRARSTKTHQSLRDRNISIEVVHTVKPQRSIKQPHRARGQSNALKYKGISQKATHYQPDETIYENTQNILPPPPYTLYAPTPQHQYRNEVDDEDIYDAPESTGSSHPSRPQSAHQQHPQMKREPSFSGKPPPPPVPTPQPRLTQPMVPPQTRPSQPMMPPQAKQPNKPQVTSRPTSAASRPTKPIAPPPSAPTAAPRPMGRPNTAPKPTESFNEGQDSPSVNELRNKFNQQNVANKPAPAVKTKPMMPPPAYRPR